MIKTVYKYLSSDNELVTLLKHVKGNSKIAPFKPDNKDNYPYIVYEVSPFQAGHVTQNRCDIRIYSKNEIELESIANRVLKLLHFGNRPGFILDGKRIKNSSHVGGGVLYGPDTKVIEQILTFNIKAN